MSNNSVHKKIEARMGRPNARPIRATSGNVPDILADTVAEIDQHGSVVLIWLKQTFSAKNKWRAFGHLYRRKPTAPAASGQLLHPRAVRLGGLLRICR